MFQWIEYSLVVFNGIGNQPYETLVPLGVNFDGGYYVENGRYRGRLSGNQEQIDNALRSLTMFGVQVLTESEILTIVERMIPTNSLVRTLLGCEDCPSGETEQYIGPASLTDTLEITRPLSTTPF
jgi:hypothetical protein